MRKAIERAQQESSGARAYLLAAYYVITGNISLMIALIGVGMILFGATVVNGSVALPVVGTGLQHNILAGMLGVWGATFIGLGVVIYTILLANKLYARATASA